LDNKTAQKVNETNPTSTFYYSIFISY
jgi:hypothetical protein